MIAILFGEYMALAMRPASTAQTPENLFRERILMQIVGVLVIVFAFCTLVNIPILEQLTMPKYITLN